jgi:hypothetical protein
MPSSTVARTVGSQYYWILHFDPIAILGYIAVLEGYPPNEDQIRRLILKSGIPESAFTTYLKHAALDRTHSSDLDKLIDSLPLSSQQLGVIGTSALGTIDLLVDATSQVVDSLCDG